jgi:hypothetical protein
MERTHRSTGTSTTVRYCTLLLLFLNSVDALLLDATRYSSGDLDNYLTLLDIQKDPFATPLGAIRGVRLLTAAWNSVGEKVT